VSSATALAEGLRTRFRAVPGLIAGLVARPALSGYIKRGYAIGLMWTISDSDRPEAIEGVARHYGLDLVAVAGALDADGRSTLIALAHSGESASGERPLAWCVSHAMSGNWIGAWQAPAGGWWTVVVREGRLLAGPACDKIHRNAGDAARAIAAEIADAAADGESYEAVYGTPGLALDGIACRPLDLDAALAQAAEIRKKSSGRGGRRAPWPRLRRTKMSEHLRRQAAIGAGALAVLALAWWLVASLVSRADVRNAVAPPPPPPPPPPWIIPLQRLPAAAWTAACRRQTDILAREIAGWSLVARECSERAALVRWQRRGDAGVTVGDLERAFSGFDPRTGLDIVVSQQGNVATASLPMATPVQRQATGAIAPALAAPAIERRMVRLGQAAGIRVDMRPRTQLQARPNDKRPYWSLAFSADLPAGASIEEAARALPVPGLSIKEAKWELRTLQWALSGEVFERN